MFEFKWTRERLDGFVKVAVVMIAAVIVAVLLGWTWAYPLLKSLEEPLKLTSYAVGPMLALLGFVLGVRDKIELTEAAAKLGAQREVANNSEQRARTAEREAKLESDKASKLRAELEGITKGAEQLWKLRPARPFASYRERCLETEGAKVLSIVNLKGGVGKTTIAANYAAYVSEVLHKRVLVIDLDYQGSLSSMLLTSVGRDDVESKVDSLFQPKADFLTVEVARTHLVATGSDIPRQLSQGWLVAAGTTLAQVENQLLLSWLLDDPSEVDVRYRLAHVLLDPRVRRQYDLIIFDLPPRMTLGAINALVASNYFCIPTVLDGLSTEAVPLLTANVRNLKQDLNLHVDLIGVIGTLTNVADRSPREKKYLSEAAQRAAAEWFADPTAGADEALAFQASIPKRAALSEAAGNSIALFGHEQGQSPIQSILTALFSEMSQRIGI